MKKKKCTHSMRKKWKKATTTAQKNTQNRTHFHPEKDKDMMGKKANVAQLIPSHIFACIEVLRCGKQRQKTYTYIYTDTCTLHTLTKRMRMSENCMHLIWEPMFWRWLRHIFNAKENEKRVRISLTPHHTGDIPWKIPNETRKKNATRKHTYPLPYEMAK